MFYFVLTKLTPYSVCTMQGRKRKAQDGGSNPDSAHHAKRPVEAFVNPLLREVRDRWDPDGSLSKGDLALMMDLQREKVKLMELQLLDSKKVDEPGDLVVDDDTKGVSAVLQSLLFDAGTSSPTCGDVKLIGDGLVNPLPAGATVDGEASLGFSMESSIAWTVGDGYCDLGFDMACPKAAGSDAFRDESCVFEALDFGGL